MLSVVRDRFAFHRRKIVVMSCVLAAWLVSAPSATAAPILSVVPSSQVVAPDGTFTVDFRIDETEPTDEINLGWIQLGLAFSSDTLSLLDIAVGSLLSTAGETFLFADPVEAPSDQVGLVSLIISGLNDLPLASGGGVFLTATFLAVAEGTGSIAATFDDFRLDGLWNSLAFGGDPVEFTGTCEDLFCETLNTLRDNEQLRFTQAVSGSTTIAAPAPTPVPEPGTLLLLSTGLASSVVAARRRKRNGASPRQ